MGKRLQREIKQAKPFGSVAEEAYLNVIRTADALLRGFTEAFKPHELTSTQYNALRILRGAGDDALTCGAIAERMVTRDPDVTRLLDRLEARGLVVRERSRADRRVVLTRISGAGLELLDALDAKVEAIHERQLGHMTREDLERLVVLLEKARIEK
jgi:DNA-binding MarR family transcriptional regulator